MANGYPEIIPLSNPITWKGEIFRAQVVDKAGKPVANAEIEIEYLNANIKNSKFVGELQKEKLQLLFMQMKMDISLLFQYIKDIGDLQH